MAHAPSYDDSVFTSSESPRGLSLYDILMEDLRVQEPVQVNAWTMFLYLGRASYRAVILYRLSAVIADWGPVGKFFSQLVMNLNLMLHGCEIWPSAKIGAGLLLPHPIGLQVGSVQIGTECTICERVTFGVRRNGQGYTPYLDRPVIGNHVYISPGAVLTGAISIGDCAFIGPNAVVLHSVTPSTSVEGVPARPV